MIFYIDAFGFVQGPFDHVAVGPYGQLYGVDVSDRGNSETPLDMKVGCKIVCEQPEASDGAKTQAGA